MSLMVVLVSIDGVQIVGVVVLEWWWPEFQNLGFLILFVFSVVDSFR